LRIAREDIGRHKRRRQGHRERAAREDETLSPTSFCWYREGSASRSCKKAAVAAIPIIVAISAPSSLAVDTAQRLGITLVGFLRGSNFNVYTHQEALDVRRVMP